MPFTRFAAILALVSGTGLAGCLDSGEDDLATESQELAICPSCLPDDPPGNDLPDPDPTCRDNTGASARQAAINSYISEMALTSCSASFVAYGGFETTRSCSGGGRFGYGARIIYNPSTECAHGVPRGASGTAQNAIYSRWMASGGNGTDLLGGPTSELFETTVPAGAPKKYFQYFDRAALAVGTANAPTTAFAVGGYHTTAGPTMRTRWQGLGSTRQYPIENTICDGNGRCKVTLEPDAAGINGRITKHTSRTAAYYVGGTFYTSWAAAGGTDYGWPTSDRTADGTNRAYQTFHNGSVIASASAGGANPRRLDGALGTKWLAVRGTTGYPMNGTVVTSNGGRGVDLADTSKLYLEAGASAAFRVRGVILQKYVASSVWKTWFDAPGGAYGYPLGDEIANGLGDYVQIFRGGVLDASSTCSASLCRDPDHLVSGAQASAMCNVGGDLMTCAQWGADNGDADLDDIPDALEQALIERFKPEMHYGFGADYAQAYGTGEYLGKGGPVAPAVVRFVSGATDSVLGGQESWRGWNCGERGYADGSQFEDKRCIEIIYTLPYNWDLGDPETNIGEHRGDSESFAVLVARRDPYSWQSAPTWGTSWATASTDAGRWRLVRRWASAHYGTGSWDSSAGDVGPIPGGFSSPTTRIYASNNKHGSYFSIGACDAGANWIDDCSDRVGAVFLNHANAGEEGVHPSTRFQGARIPYPGATSQTAAGAPDYLMWSGEAFGSSTPYAQLLASRFFDWSFFNTFPGGRPLNGGP